MKRTDWLTVPVTAERPVLSLASARSAFLPIPAAATVGASISASHSQSFASRRSDVCSHRRATPLIPLSAFRVYGETSVTVTYRRHHSQ